MGDVRLQSRQFFLFENALLFTKPGKKAKRTDAAPTYEIRRAVEPAELGRARVSTLACCADGAAHLTSPCGLTHLASTFDLPIDLTVRLHLPTAHLTSPSDLTHLTAPCGLTYDLLAPAIV